MNINVYCTKRFTKMFEKLSLVTPNALRAFPTSIKINGMIMSFQLKLQTYVEKTNVKHETVAMTCRLTTSILSFVHFTKIP